MNKKVNKELIKNKSKKVSKKKFAQGTIEYLVILAVVVVLALVAVVMLLGVFDGGSTSSNSDRISNTSSDLGVMDSLVSVDGNFFVQLKNNSGENLEVKTITIEDSNVNYFTNNKLNVSSSGAFVIPASEECVVGESIVKDVIVTFLVDNVTVTKTLKVTFSCGDYSLQGIQLAGTTDINKCRLNNPNYPDSNSCGDAICSPLLACYDYNGVENLAASLDDEEELSVVEECHLNDSNYPGSNSCSDAICSTLPYCQINAESAYSAYSANHGVYATFVDYLVGVYDIVASLASAIFSSLFG
ncbi:MAG: hypothetical protein PHQ98_04050 [Candidatus ainarchaeum sp.]|nr:hypothetical protein [Candidatus ainarchaeum sp.]